MIEAMWAAKFDANSAIVGTGIVVSSNGKVYMKKLVLLFCLFLTACAEMDIGSHKSALELQSIQTKEFEAEKELAFVATLSVLQDLKFIVESVNYKTGLITVESPTKQSFVPFVGQVMQRVKVNAFVEELTPGRTKVKLSFVNSQKSSSGYGMNGDMKAEKKTLVKTPDIYQDMFSKVQEKILIRKNM